MYDVGDAVELTFTTTPGATVTVTWIDPAGTVVLNQTPVAESDSTPGDFPWTFLFTVDGVWCARFRGSGTVDTVEEMWLRALPVGGPPPLATLGEVVELYGAMTPAQEQVSKGLLRRASAMVRGRFPDLADRMSAGTLDPMVVGGVVVNMVLRVLRNPDGLRSETVGPFTRSWDTTMAAGLLALSDDDVAALTPAEDEDDTGTVVPATITGGFGTTMTGWATKDSRGG